MWLRKLTFFRAQVQEPDMAETLIATGRVKPRSNNAAIEGMVLWAPAKSIWYSSMLITGLIGGVFCFS